MIIGVYLFTGLFVVLMCVGISQVPLKKRLDEYSQIHEHHSFIKVLEPAIQTIAYYLKYFDQGKVDKKYRRKLLSAGNPLHLIPIEFLAFKYLCALGGLFFGIIILCFSNKIHPFLVVMIVIFLYFFPDLWLDKVTSRRKRQLFNDLPYCMDVMKLCVEAGLSFRAAIRMVVERGPEGPLKEEMERMLQDLRLGKLQRDTLTDLAVRTDMNQIKSFASALNMAEYLGTPLAEALDIQSQVRRNERAQHVEKRANEATVKILFPLLLIILAVFVVMLGPIILKFMAEGI